MNLNSLGVVENDGLCNLNSVFDFVGMKWKTKYEHPQIG
jgi:hypothetical protein